MALYALQTLPVNFAGILLILLAIIFFILEIKVVSYGMLSIAGAVSLFLGSLMLFRVPGHSTRIAYSLLIPTVLAVSGFFAALTSLAVRAQRSKHQAGTEMLIGMVGEVTQDLAPEGKVFVSGELWNAVADEAIAAGQKVEILAVDSLKLKVKKIDAR
jgi:membrane-bound serine protease (ClpP class)